MIGGRVPHRRGVHGNKGLHPVPSHNFRVARTGRDTRRGRRCLGGGLLTAAFLLAALPHSASAWIWRHAGVDSSGDVGQFCSLAVGSDGSLHACGFHYDAFSEGGNYLRYAYNPSPLGAGPWTVRTADPNPNTGAYASIALDPGGQPHIAYFEGGLDQNLKHAWFDPAFNAWRTERVDVSGNEGQFTSIAVNEAGTVYIAYFDASAGGLKLATKPSGGSWSLALVDTAGTVGPYAAISTHDGLRIAYYDLTHRDLKFAKWNGGGWTITRVDSVGDVGRYVSLAAGDEETFIAYYDVTHGDLKVASSTNDVSWLVLTVDSAGDVGAGTSVAVDGHGRPHVLYYDKTNGDLLYAARYRGTWIFNTVATGGDVGRFSSIRMENRDLPNAVYYDETKGVLRYTHVDGDPTGVADPGGPAAVVRPVLRVPANPVRAPARLEWTSPAGDRIEVSVFDVTGGMVRRLFRGEVAPGLRTFAWDGRDESGRLRPAGVYFVRAAGLTGAVTARLVLLR